MASAIGNLPEAGGAVTVEFSIGAGPQTASFEARVVPGGGGEAVAIVRNITDLKKMRHELNHKARHDPLRACRIGSP